MWYFENEETLSRVAVVFTALVDYANKAMFFRLNVRDDVVYLAGFQRGWISRIVNTNRENSFTF